MSLEDDIARVAALRGMSRGQVAAVQVRAVEAEEARVKLTLAIAEKDRAAALANLRISMEGSVKEQMNAFDHLPRRSREFLRYHTPQISARRWRIALDHFDGDQERLIAAVLAREAAAG